MPSDIGSWRSVKNLNTGAFINEYAYDKREMQIAAVCPRFLYEILLWPGGYPLIMVKYSAEARAQLIS
jgi:hypothetical protein